MATLSSSRVRACAVLILIFSTVGCTHALKVKNLDDYSTSVQLQRFDYKPNVAVLPFEGNSDSVYFFNALIERINENPGVGEVVTGYTAKAPGAFKPDLIFSVKQDVEYRSSGWNFLINWPGFLIFTPAWNGYVYHADVDTHITIHDGVGRVLSTSQIPMTYSIRHAEMDRTIFTGLAWFEVSSLAFFGGIYNAFVFDRDLIGSFHPHIKDNYSTYVSNQVGSKIRAAIDAVRPQRPPVAAAPRSLETPTPPLEGELPRTSEESPDDSEAQD